MSESSDRSSTGLFCGEHAGDVVSCNTTNNTLISHHESPLLSDDEDDSTILRLIDCEPHHIVSSDYLQRCRDRSVVVTARQDSINWILKVHAYYHFRAVTALLSVNYFDRFLSSHSLPKANGWQFQLLSVACLSLAAKMEEPQVPLLLDLQILEPRFLFEPKTIQRMELRILSILNWRLNSVTPLDYLHYFISKLPSSSSKQDSFSRVLTSSSDLILRTSRVLDFLGFAPSTIAVAAVLCAAGESLELPAICHDRVNNEMVRSCRQLMEEHLIDTSSSDQLKHRRA